MDGTLAQLLGSIYEQNAQIVGLKETLGTVTKERDEANGRLRDVTAERDELHKALTKLTVAETA